MRMERLKKTFTEAIVSQRTPKRVLHRRADITREKHIYETKIKRLTQNSIEIRIRCQGGLYVKELVTGDEGRTVPNMSEALSARAEASRT